MKPNMVAAAVLAAGALFLTWVIDVRAQEGSQWAYTLEDQNEPEYLALRTSQGTFRILPELGCEYLLANQNVEIQNIEIQNMRVTHVLLTVETFDGFWQPFCQAQVTAQMDDVPCMMNGWGHCDVRVENEWVTEDAY